MNLIFLPVRNCLGPYFVHSFCTFWLRRWWSTPWLEQKPWKLLAAGLDKNENLKIAYPSPFDFLGIRTIVHISLVSWPIAGIMEGKLLRNTRYSSEMKLRFWVQLFLRKYRIFVLESWLALVKILLNFVWKVWLRFYVFLILKISSVGNILAVFGGARVGKKCYIL